MMLRLIFFFIHAGFHTFKENFYDEEGCFANSVLDYNIHYQSCLVTNAQD